jgi:hypothetical protein
MDVNSSIIAVVALLASFGMPIIITAIVLWHITRKTRLAHDTLLKLADKGAPIPPGLLPEPQPRSPASDFRTGVVLLGAGIGLALLLWEIHAPMGVGAIPALMGIGYIIAWKVEKKEQSRS